MNRSEKDLIERVTYLGWSVADGESVVIATVFTNAPLSPKDIQTELKHGVVRACDLSKMDSDALTVDALCTKSFLLEVLTHCPSIVDVFFQRVGCVPGWKWEDAMVETDLDL